MQELIEKLKTLQSKNDNLLDIDDISYDDIDEEYDKIKKMQMELYDLRNEWEVETFLEFGAMGEDPRD